jgi:hypothetical protein
MPMRSDKPQISSALMCCNFVVGVGELGPAVSTFPQYPI